jgi:hypothetical protein
MRRAAQNVTQDITRTIQMTQRRTLLPGGRAALTGLGRRTWANVRRMGNLARAKRRLPIAALRAGGIIHGTQIK